VNETDRIRGEEFRQFKKEIRGSGEYLIVGFDVAKDGHVAFFGMASARSSSKNTFFFQKMGTFPDIPQGLSRHYNN